MEILAQCARVLYDNRLLDLGKRLCVAEDKVPQTKFEDEAEWIIAKEQFRKSVRDYVLQEIVIISIRESVQDVVKKICTKYAIYLRTLKKGQHEQWCGRKSQQLRRLLYVGIAGLREVYKSGSGSYPYHNWRPSEWLHFIYGLIINFETKYEGYKYAYMHGWLEQIPYYQCRICDAKIDTVLCYRGQYKYIFDQRCVICIKKVLAKVKCIQALWRGYSLRRSQNKVGQI